MQTDQPAHPFMMPNLFLPLRNAFSQTRKMSVCRFYGLIEAHFLYKTLLFSILPPGGPEALINNARCLMWILRLYNVH